MIDARGSSDPAATEMAVHRAMRQYLGPMVGVSLAAAQDQRRRVPALNRT